MIRKMWYVHRMEYYAASKKEEILPSATTRRGPGDIKLSERSCAQKVAYCMNSIYVESVAKPTEAERTVWVARGLRGGASGKMLVQGCRVAVVQSKFWRTVQQRAWEYQ